MARHETAAPPEMNAKERLTFLDLVATVEEFAENDAEAMAIDALPRAA